MPQRAKAPKPPRLLPDNPRTLLARNRDPRGRRLSYTVQTRNALEDLLSDLYRRISFDREVTAIALRMHLMPQTHLTVDAARSGAEAALKLISDIETQCRVTRAALEREEAKAVLLAKMTGSLI